MSRFDAEERALTWRGEVWTDARGYATIVLPPCAALGGLDLDYELNATENGAARVAGELTDGRFTIATEEPHVKVAWRLTAVGQAQRRDRTT